MKVPLCIGYSLSWRRGYQTHVHPRLFHQYIQLTDGSAVRIVGVSNKRPFLKLGVDALSHPSWNPVLKNRMLVSEHEEVTKFKERFEHVTDEASLSSFDGLVGVLSTKMTKKREAAVSGSKSKSGKKK